MLPDRDPGRRRRRRGRGRLARGSIQNQAVPCGFAGQGDGTNALISAEARAEEIKQAAG
jgi:hypothetical protein